MEKNQVTFNLLCVPFPKTVALGFVQLTPDTIATESLFCIKDVRSAGFKAKEAWLKDRFAEGLQIHLAKDAAGKPEGFIEFVPIENAWRPVSGTKYLFIHCMMVYPKKAKNKGLGSQLIDLAKQAAQANGLNGLAVMTSKGSWLTDKPIFLKNGFESVGKLGRMELLVLRFNEAPAPTFIDWTENQKAYQGWHLLYSDQCPWHCKAADVLGRVAKEHGIDLQVKRIDTAKEAQQAPSGFGVFSLIRNGMLLEDHYISETRFRNILKAQLAK